MQLVQLIIPAEAAHDTIFQLGEVRSSNRAGSWRGRHVALRTRARRRRRLPCGSREAFRTFLSVFGRCFFRARPY